MKDYAGRRVDACAVVSVKDMGGKGRGTGQRGSKDCSATDV